MYKILHIICLSMLILSSNLLLYVFNQISLRGGLCTQSNLEHSFQRLGIFGNNNSIYYILCQQLLTYDKMVYYINFSVLSNQSPQNQSRRYLEMQRNIYIFYLPKRNIYVVSLKANRKVLY